MQTTTEKTARADVNEILTEAFELRYESADDFREDKSGCYFDGVWVCGEMIADLMDRAYRAGQDSV